MFCINLYMLIVSPIVFIHASLVHIDQGILNGTILKSRNGNKYYGFYGIPYAQPPIDVLRFQPPKLPPPSWPGIKDATQKPPFCLQVMNRGLLKSYHGSEDCLYLQVFSQNINPTEDVKLKPVLVFFHGGGFVEGSSNLYTEKVFMDKAIIMVLVNYRLGIFGFFSNGESDYPGNYGLKDQTAALQWIQKNIRAFGGDPSAVTIMGHSAGSASVQFHTLSPLSKGLFHRGILQGGTVLMPWSYSSTKRAQKIFQDFRQYTNCVRPSTNESVACLLALPAEKLIELSSSHPIHSNRFEMRPVIEPFGVAGAFMSTEPYLLTYPNPKIPLMIGFNSNEQLGLPMNHEWNGPDEKTFDVLLSQELNYASVSNLEWTQNITSEIKKLYFGNNFSNRNFNTTTELRNDLLWKLGTFHTIRTYSGVIYFYEYDFRNSSRSTADLGVGHGEELEVQLYDLELNDAQRNFSEIVITYWSNFVSTGDPNVLDKKLPIEWIPAKTSSDDYLRKIHFTNNGFQMQRELIPTEKVKLFMYYIENRNRF